MNPARLRVGDVDSLGDAVAGVVGVIDRLGAGGDTVTARTTYQGDDTWPARMVLMDGNQAANLEAKQLTGLLAEHAGRTSASVVIQGEGSSSHAVVLEATAEGRIVMPASGLDLVIVGLTEDEAKGCATLLAQGDDMEDVPMPLPQAGADDEGWRAWADAAGALRPEHTVPRGEDHPDEEAASLLDADDQAYVSTAATTPQDLESLAPQVPVSVRESVDEADPGLEADLSAWWDEDTNLPRLQMLGPVHAQTRGTPRADRKPYLTEMVAYLVLRPQGATSEETAEAFSITPAKCRDYVAKCRSWLGTNPRTGEPHLPHAQKAPAAKLRGGSVYQTLDVLNDVDLFRRLRVRGEARGGTQGIEDLKTALS
ncbi:hypothetical protein [Ornithinimicrobium sp. INDO-MA30-4]|uniref:hypothetical protein n=1 Tax=Ornithinimicrobium sp. INDO-MA30-4 TaxID=2908651 RepID=UPI001F1F9414|nr:hypothetical protein [Ornithinimicrobium sp. INDO-MA30-4]UJH71763.1 hypothetical protein L0A91_16905 [Ornithinimicrobium sp. INDO-MA30-4]